MLPLAGSLCRNGIDESKYVLDFMIAEFIQDGLFAAIAAIGFASISLPPRRAFAYCGVIAAVGHSARYILMSPLAEVHIIPSTLIASFLVGLMSVLISHFSKIPPETYLIPSLLPMIPGIYAYKTFGGLALCLLSDTEETFNHAFYLSSYNGVMCCCLLLCMVIGAVSPIFLLGRISFQATR